MFSMLPGGLQDKTL